jgi:hypothetical protein
MSNTSDGAFGASVPLGTPIYIEWRGARVLNLVRPHLGSTKFRYYEHQTKYLLNLVLVGISNGTSLERY